MEEEKIIERLQKRIKYKNKDVIVGIGDDTSVIKLDKKFFLLFTNDVVIENIHFKKENTTPCQIGWKSLAVNLSDISAMGGIPLYALVSLGLPEGNFKLVEGIYKGIETLSKKYGVEIVGGNISKSKILFIDIFLVGKVEKRNLKLRNNAKPGDLIYVTGKLGASQIRKHLQFEPRIKESRELIKKLKISAMIDISDGLSSDLIKLAKASKVGFEIYYKQIPVSYEALKISKTEEEAISHALNDGEDYELLFTVPVKLSMNVPKKIFSTPITCIGKIIQEQSYYGVLRNKREKIKSQGFNHFGKYSLD